jgi:hypothetical protein
MATVDSDNVVCGGIHAMTVAVLVLSGLFLSNNWNSANSVGGYIYKINRSYALSN